ncbi:hypothetical protein D3877_11370 [Azospirillum cavernae]|uniref:Ribbon-helix-helix domain-containing protein n=1 Tax=Azospirillum cavernae TaxID=2320860 RepID=A0A418W4U0_9PROT|nr:ribbon-helix-helix domain-containing protein [Azospirillum cavernae]RJF85040.1 hypothetical protein D3877_11370 [Azospirillum cavernae]
MLQLPIARHIGNMMIELEPYLWGALEDIALREQLDIDGLCASVLDRLEERQRRYGDVTDTSAALVSALRVLPASYYRHAAMMDGNPSSAIVEPDFTTADPLSEVLHILSGVASGKSA